MEIIGWNIIDLEGLNNLSYIGNGYSDQGISINYNTSLENLSGINNLTGINGDLEIRGNPFLASLTGLESLTQIENAIEIYDNALLSDFCSLTSFFINNSFNGNYGVENNLINPTIQDIIDGNCN